tara:strand:- start:4112 stop:4807 length:696 start_codon:yes stop_codon:yes gene_type:complete
MGLETIYGIMITGKTPERILMANLSAQSFFKQTYSNKHLLIIDDGDFDFNFSNSVATHLKVSNGLTLGELRNIALDYLPVNSVWVQWDDDDWHHPNVISEQYEELSRANVPCCFMKSQIRYSFNKNCAWIFGENLNSEYRGICGTGMFRNSEIRYPALEKSEDSVFSRYYENNDILWDNPPHYYLRFIHNNNTWDEDHFLCSRMEKNTWDINGYSREYLEKILDLYKSSKC